LFLLTKIVLLETKILVFHTRMKFVEAALTHSRC